MDVFKKAVFIDKDGTLIPDIPYNVNKDLITLEQGALQGLQMLGEEGYIFVIVSNQSGVAKGYFNEAALSSVEKRISDLLRAGGIEISGFYYCPHHPAGYVPEYSIECDCRKPKPGLIIRAAEDLQIDISQSWMIGDILNDIEAGKRAGCRTALIDNGNETEWLQNNWRVPDIKARDLRDAALKIKEYQFQIAKIDE